MRARLRARASPIRVGTPPSTVLLATEESYPSVATDHADWCNALVNGMPEFDFLLWSLTSGPRAEPVYRLPANVAGLVHPRPADGDRTAGRPGGASAPRVGAAVVRDVERDFVPALRAFLDSTARPAGGEAEVVDSMLRLRAALRR